MAQFFTKNIGINKIIDFSVSLLTPPPSVASCMESGCGGAAVDLALASDRLDLVLRERAAAAAGESRAVFIDFAVCCGD